MMTSYRGFPLVLCYAVLSGFLRHPVQAAVVTCNVTTKDLGQHLGLKFRLNVDIGKEHLSFTIQRSDLNEPIQHDDDTPLVCKWDKSVHLNCQLSSGAYSFNRSVGRELILEIVNVTEESEGMYRIQVFQEKSVHVETCTLIPLGSGGTEVNTSPVTPYTSSTSGKAHVSEETTREPEDGDGIGKIVGAVVGSLIAVVITIIIIIILKRRRQSKQKNNGLRNSSSNDPVQDLPERENSPQEIAAPGPASSPTSDPSPDAPNTSHEISVEDNGQTTPPGKSYLKETSPQNSSKSSSEEELHETFPPVEGELVNGEGGFNDTFHTGDHELPLEKVSLVKRGIEIFERKKRKTDQSEHNAENSSEDVHSTLLPKDGTSADPEETS